MIMMTRLDGAKILVNCETIKYVEVTPDTLITFINGDSLFVRESLDQMEQSVIDYRRRIISLDPRAPN